jgi:hypothetical protein
VGPAARDRLRAYGALMIDDLDTRPRPAPRETGSAGRPSPRSRRPRPAARAVAIAVAVAVVLTGVVVLARRGGHESTGSGSVSTWRREPVARAFAPGVLLRGVAASTSGFVAVGTSQPAHEDVTRVGVWTSSDGTAWRRSRFGVRGTSPSLLTWHDRLVLSVFTGSRVRSFTSRDGLRWDEGSSFASRLETWLMPLGARIAAAVVADGPWVVRTSRDGVHWSGRTTTPVGPTTRFRGRYVALRGGSDHTLATSPDARRWATLTDHDAFTAPLFQPPVATDGRRLYALQSEPSFTVPGGRLFASTDATHWTEVVSFHTRFPDGNPDHMTRSGSWWVLGGNRGGAVRQSTMWVTRDLRHWQEMPARLRGPVGATGSSVVLAARGRTVIGTGFQPRSFVWVWHRPPAS